MKNNKNVMKLVESVLKNKNEVERFTRQLLQETNEKITQINSSRNYTDDYKRQLIAELKENNRDLVTLKVGGLLHDSKQLTQQINQVATQKLSELYAAELPANDPRTALLKAQLQDARFKATMSPNKDAKSLDTFNQLLQTYGDTPAYILEIKHTLQGLTDVFIGTEAQTTLASLYNAADEALFSSDQTEELALCRELVLENSIEMLPTDLDKSDSPSSDTGVLRQVLNYKDTVLLDRPGYLAEKYEEMKQAQEPTQEDTEVEQEDDDLTTFTSELFDKEGTQEVAEVQEEVVQEEVQEVAKEVK